MGDTWMSVLLVLVFVLVGGVFAAAEMALVSLRQSQIDELSKSGRRGAKVAHLAGDPNRFLAAVQIGVTFAGFLSAAFGAATIADDLAPVLSDWGLPDGWADPVALIAVTVVISYLSLVLGELVPKRLALQRPTGVSLTLGPPVSGFATVVRPFVWLLSVSTDAVVRVVGGDPKTTRQALSAAEVRSLILGAAEIGAEERELIADVFEVGERTLREVMIPRTEVDFISADTPVFAAVKQARGQPHSRYPVIAGSADEVVGFVHVRDLLDPELAGRSVRVAELARPVLRMPDSKSALKALGEMRRGGSQLAIVADEYGGTAGIVTMEDLVEEIVGEISDEYDTPEFVSGDAGGATEVDGLLNLEDFADATGCELPEGPYETVAGYIVARLGELPNIGDEVDAPATILRVTALDGRRVSRVTVLPAQPKVVADDPGTDEQTQEG